MPRGRSFNHNPLLAFFVVPLFIPPKQVLMWVVWGKEGLRRRGQHPNFSTQEIYRWPLQRSSHWAELLGKSWGQMPIELWKIKKNFWPKTKRWTAAVQCNLEITNLSKTFWISNSSTQKCNVLCTKKDLCVCGIKQIPLLFSHTKSQEISHVIYLGCSNNSFSHLFLNIQYNSHL